MVLYERFFMRVKLNTPPLLLLHHYYYLLLLLLLHRSNEALYDGKISRI